MLDKTIIFGLAAVLSLATTAPGFASIGSSPELRPAFGLAANWLKPASVMAATGAAFGGLRPAGILEASLDPVPLAILRPTPAPQATNYGLFGSVALPIRTLPATKQWQSVSTTDFTTQYGAHCHTAACSTGIDALLTKAALKAEGEPALEALNLVNNSVNNLIRYRADRDDHWATPVETAAGGSGDCEDFAIAKLWLLRSIGYTPEQLQLVVLKDTRQGAYHAVLAVHIDGRSYILDNLSSRVLPDTALRAYVPIESFSGTKSFIHGFAGKHIDALALTTSVQPAD